MYVTHRSFAAPAPAIFSGYTIHIRYHAGVSIMPPRVLGSGPKPEEAINSRMSKIKRLSKQSER